MLSNTTSQCQTQTVDYCFHHANEYVTTIVPFFSNPKNNSPQSAFYTAPSANIPTFLNSPDGNPGFSK